MDRSKHRRLGFHAMFLTVWAARIGSVLVGALLAAFALEPSGPARPTEIVALALFPGCVLAGMAIGWWRELLGGAVSLAGLGAFYLWMTLVSGRVPAGPYFLVFASPAFLFLAAGCLKRAAGRRGTGIGR